MSENLTKSHCRPVYRLVLHPRSASARLEPPDMQDLQRHLTMLGLLGESFAFAAEQRFRLGERFFQFLTFMGCAPSLKLQPDEPGDEKFCHFRFLELPQPRFRYLRPEAKGRCPHCRKPAVSADEIQRLYFRQRHAWLCPRCQQPSRPEEINWKHEAGEARVFIELLDVHPHEVVPTDNLLQQLETTTRQPWQYFYADS